MDPEYRMINICLLLLQYIHKVNKLQKYAGDYVAAVDIGFSGVDFKYHIVVFI